MWAKLAVHEAVIEFFKLCHAKEEITRLNIKVGHLQTAIHDKKQEVSQTIANLQHSDPLFALEFECCHQPCAAMNAVHIHHLGNLKNQYGLL
ncbi:hypothetical protein PISMIDRAFT_111776 [Pisolithus microcarpus 441]|uniref:Uncharacterized protein n=1 Tax=Pisolithus microcarpus 441 TaxID=765257 RepID=A0A0C9YKS9_9AGAM|nr:hypothetical protein BKA83DRAFT_111776 [Pisolithus microcarpus]KIK17281.1 hypothetical protein PISMIDRAFT_111776 [Pisolithus microcarpus 441]